MPELRRDPIMNRWVIIASERAKRPSDFRRSKQTNLISFCPFCPGNEEKTPQEIYRFPVDAPESDWKIRVVPNKFPALILDGELQRSHDGVYEKMDGLGAHEVVIETPLHNIDFADYDNRHVLSILTIYRDRMLQLGQDPRFQYVLIFKNKGTEAGASLDHPHTQIIALPIVPKRVQEEMTGCKGYYRIRKSCLFCKILEKERQDSSRIVFENDEFISFEPFAARFPFETWILPKVHQAHFFEITDSQVKSLAEALRHTLCQLKLVLEDPPYNFMLHTSPRKILSNKLPYYHWHLEITPKMTQVAGFEWGTGFYINPVPPEQAAQYLRSGKAE